MTMIEAIKPHVEERLHGLGATSAMLTPDSLAIELSSELCESRRFGSIFTSPEGKWFASFVYGKTYSDARCFDDLDVLKRLDLAVCEVRELRGTEHAVRIQ